VTEALVLMTVAGFCLGGGIAFHRQGRPLWATVALVLLGFGLLYLGATAARNG